MNYLKAIQKIKDVEISETHYHAAKMQACIMVQKIAEMMYDAELDRQQYLLWSTIKDIAESLKITY